MKFEAYYEVLRTFCKEWWTWVQMGAKAWMRSFFCPHCLWVLKVQTNYIRAGRVWMSPPPKGIPTTQNALTIFVLVSPLPLYTRAWAGHNTYTICCAISCACTISSTKGACHHTVSHSEGTCTFVPWLTHFWLMPIWVMPFWLAPTHGRMWHQ